MPYQSRVDRIPEEADEPEIVAPEVGEPEPSAPVSGFESQDLRAMLVNAMQDVYDGKLESSRGKAMAMLASQVHASLSIELEARRQQLHLLNGKPQAVGRLRIAR